LKLALARFYPADLLANALTQLRTKCASQSSVLTATPPRVLPRWRLDRSVLEDASSFKQAVDIRVFDDTTISGKITADDDEAVRNRIMRGGYLIDDKRTDKQTSRAYNTQVKMALSNPSDTGLYQVLTKEGDFERMLVITSPHGEQGRSDFVTVVDADGDNGWLNADRTAIWVRTELENFEKFHEWVDKQNKPDSLESDGVYIALSRNGQGSAPFRVKESLGKGVYEVAFANDVNFNYRRPEFIPNHPPRPAVYGPSAGPVLLRVSDREGTNFRSTGGTLYLPADCRILRLKAPPKAKDDSNGCGCLSFGLESMSEKPPIQPGNTADLQLAIMQKTSSLKLIPSGSEMMVNERRFSKLGALFHLVLEHGFREAEAKQLLKQAEQKHGAKFRVKYAAPAGSYDAPYGPGFQQYSTGQGPGASLSFPEPYMGQDGGFGQYASTYPQQENIQIPELAGANNTDPEIFTSLQPPPDPLSMQVAQQAAGSGQKEVFDTAVLGNLLKTVRDESLVDRYLGDVLKALDRILRMLFLFYWHGEQFQDRYGKADMPELEDTLRNAAEVVGDLVLFLKTKTVGPESHELGPSDITDSAQL
jgi:hypothetical protein